LPKVTNVDDYLKSDFLQNLQQHLLTQDELPPGCSLCQEKESNNQLSGRQLKNSFFQNQVLYQTQIQELDTHSSNTCNLTCIMCSPAYSSAVGAEQKRLGWITKTVNFDETDLILESINQLPDLQHIHIAGGEFFYAKQCVKILQAIKTAKIPRVSFITNGTICSDKHLAILKEFENLNIRFSIDGTGDHYNFVRYPSDFDEVKANILNFKTQLPRAHFELYMVVQPLNIFNILEWTAWANQTGIETHWGLVDGDMGWSAITQQEKALACDFIMSNIDRYNLNKKQLLSILNYAKNTIPKLPFAATKRDQFVSKLVQLCQSRKLAPGRVTNLLGSWQELKETIHLNYHNVNTLCK
jgi:organic radical activating enzyme